MADNKDNTYGSITKNADRKKETKRANDPNFSRAVNAMQDNMRQQVKSTGKTFEEAEGVSSIQNSFKGALDSLGKDMGGMARGVGSLLDKNNKLFSQVMKKQKVSGGIKFDKKDLAQLIKSMSAVPALQKGGYISKTGLAKIHAGESVFPKGSMDELISLMKDQVYHIKQISGFYDNAALPDMLKMDGKTFGEMFKGWIKGGLYSAFPTFIKIGRAIGKPFYRLFKTRGGTYAYASQLSKADSPFRQISENVGVLYTGSMLRMDRMINIQRATAEAVRDLSTYTTGKTYSAIEDVKPSKKFRLITQIAKGVGKGILGIGGAALGGMGGMALGGPLGALAGATAGGMAGWKKGPGALKALAKMPFDKKAMEQENRMMYGYDRESITDSIKEKKEELKERAKRFKITSMRKGKLALGKLAFWRGEKEGPNLLGASTPGGPRKGLGNVECLPVEICLSSIKKLSKATSAKPLGVQFAKVKSKFSKKNKDNVIDVALTPETQKVLDQVKDSSQRTAESTKKAEPKTGFFDKIFSWLLIGWGLLKSLPGKLMGWAGSALAGLAETMISFLHKPLLDLISNAARGFLKTPLGGALGGALGIAGAAYVGWEIGTWINDTFIKPFLDEQDRRNAKETQRAADALKKAQDALPKTSSEDLNKLVNQGTMTPKMLEDLKLQQYKELFGDRAKPKVTNIMKSQMGSSDDTWKTIQQITDHENRFSLEHLNEYSVYDPDQVEALRLEWLKSGDFDPYDQDFQSPQGYAQLREEAFREHMKTKLKPMKAGALTTRQKKYIDYAKKQSEKNNITPAPPLINTTAKLIEIAKENAAKTLVETYGISASDAQKYVEMAAKTMDKDTHSLTDPSILTKTALAYLESETGIHPEEKQKPGAPSDYGKNAAITEANQAAMTASAVKEGVKEGIAPAIAEQTKALNTAITATTNSGIATSNTSSVANSTSNSNSNFVYPGTKDPWSEQAQRGYIPG